jgi:hypothetical protein
MNSITNKIQIAMTTEQKIQILINGGTLTIKDEAEKKKIQERLREIKQNCTIVLSQIKDKNY